MKKTTILVLSIILLWITALPIQGEAASPIEPGALTAPPPDLVHPLTLFDPNYSYLERGAGYISELSNGRINIWGDTSATVHVGEIGVGLTLQRWTGKEWIDVANGTPSVDSDSAYAYQSHILTSVAKGYYYRTKSTHWIIHGKVYESGTRYSGSILLPK